MPAGRRRSFDEWLHEREEKYGRLRAYALPNDLIDAALEFRMQDQLTWYRETDADTGSTTNLSYEITRKSHRTKSTRRTALSAYARSNKEDEVDTVIECIANLLLFRLIDLNEHQGESPVRLHRLISHRDISDIVVDLLDCCRVFLLSPGPQLISLTESLLSASSSRLTASRHFDARQQAINIDSEHFGLSTRVLAEKVGVHGTTVMRWRKDPSYQNKVTEKRNHRIKLRDKLPP
jgi:hypothetical protein